MSGVQAEVCGLGLGGSGVASGGPEGRQERFDWYWKLGKGQVVFRRG